MPRYTKRIFCHCLKDPARHHPETLRINLPMRSASNPCLSSSFPVILLFAFFLSAFSDVKADTPLEISMQHMKKAYKALSLDLQKPEESKKPEYLSLAGVLKTESLKAIDLVPEAADSLPPEQKEAMVAAYKKRMGTFSGSVDELLQNIQSGKWDAARHSIDTLGAEMKSGHKDFRKED